MNKEAAKGREQDAVRMSTGMVYPPGMNPAADAPALPWQHTRQEIIEGVQAADHVMLAKAITLLESTRYEDQKMAQFILARCPVPGDGSLRIGITGAPGVGKSTLIESLGMYLLERGARIAALTVDPSSQHSHGSILGDKTRMPRLTAQANVFIRSSPAAGILGGVAHATRSVIQLCEAAGFTVILVETTGTGQSETEVRSMVDFFLLLVLAQAGDEVQGIKRGIMEMADAIAITKTDGDNIDTARRARGMYHRALSLFSGKESGWRPRVHSCSAITGDGIPALWNTIEAYVNHVQSNGFFSTHRSRGVRSDIVRNLSHHLTSQFLGRSGVQRRLIRIQEEVAAGQLTPFMAVQQLLFGDNR